MTRGTRADGGMGRIRGVRLPSWVWIRLGRAGGVRRVVGLLPDAYYDWLDGRNRSARLDGPPLALSKALQRWPLADLGAAAAGHERDRADNEIFVWEIGTPWDQAVRLTYQLGGDNWPDPWVAGTAPGPRPPGFRWNPHPERAAIGGGADNPGTSGAASPHLRPTASWTARCRFTETRGPRGGSGLAGASGA
jgi:hypothetical protein